MERLTGFTLVKIGRDPSMKFTFKYLKSKFLSGYSIAMKEKDTFLTSTAGTLLLCFGIIALTIPYRFPDTGVTGLAVLSNYVWGISPAWVIAFVNIVLFIWGWKRLSRRFVLWTIYVVALTTAGLKFFSLFTYPIIEETLLAALLGGVIKGIGIGLVLRDGSSTGGTDIIAVGLRKHYGVDIGTYNFYINMLILLGSYFVVGLQSVLYGGVMLYAEGLLIDNVLRSFDRRKQLFIITSKIKDTKDFIVSELGKGATVLQGQGAYTSEERPVIMTVLTRRQSVDIKRFLAENDPEAFIIVGEAGEVVGEGFKSWKGM